MEANLDEDYYQKYLEYKHQYLMLKQLKNNNDNDLEGGFSLNPLNWFKKKAVTEEAVAPSASASGTQEPEEPIVPHSTDGAYLVFYINPLNLNINKTKVFVQEHYNQEKYKIKDTIPFIEKKAFINDPEYDGNAYIVVKTGNKFKYSLLSSNKDENFDENLKLLENMKLDLDNIIQTFNDECKMTSKFTIDENLQINGRILKPIYDNIKTEYNSLKRQYELLEANYIAELSKLIEMLKKKINEQIAQREVKLYRTNTFSFTTNILDVTNNIAFLETFRRETERPVSMNMIIKIQDSYNDVNELSYIFGEYIYETTVSNTTVYTEIVREASNKRNSINIEKTNEQRQDIGLSQGSQITSYQLQSQPLTSTSFQSQSFQSLPNSSSSSSSYIYPPSPAPIMQYNMQPAPIMQYNMQRVPIVQSSPVMQMQNIPIAQPASVMQMQPGSVMQSNSMPIMQYSSPMSSPRVTEPNRFGFTTAYV